MTIVEETQNEQKVKVAIRLRPPNKREINLKTKCVVSMSQSQTILSHPTEEKEPKVFAFDHCFNSSADEGCSSYSSQEDVFQQVGSDVVESAFGGYNACIFAYGQTAIFERIERESNELTTFKAEVSYMEIYNERVRDLLDPKNSSKRPLKVREHSILGPMVEGLSVLAVSNYDQISQLMDDGNKCRTVAATNMNAESSRSHAFTGEKVSKISLVDLAGSERAQKSGAVGKRLEEGANINKSLTTLGMVISALAEKNGKKEKFVPYRDSVLTWLLKDNLGGNSKTIMIATISPSGDNYEETLSTLRYADRAKKIVQHAVINEDPNAKIIRELREEVETLRMQINQNQERQNEADELRERLAESERLVEMMNKSWEERLRETDQLNKEHQKDLAQIGICVAESGIKMEKDKFYLVNLNADPALNELLVYYINQRAVIGCGESSNFDHSRSSSSQEIYKVDFLLQGLGVHPQHALLEIVQEPAAEQEEIGCRNRLYISSLSSCARICVNGRQLEQGQRMLLRNGYRLLIGNNHFFRVNCPKDEPNSQAVPHSMSSSSIGGFDSNGAFIDYNRAWLEANSDEMGFNDSNSTANVSSAVDQYIEQIAIKHEEEKQAALEKQYEEFERYIQGLAHTLQTPSTPMTPATVPGLYGTIAGTPSCQLPPVSFPPNPRHADKEELFKQSLSILKTEIVKANALAREANLIAEELWINQGRGKRGLARYDVTLQIPAANLRPSRIKAGNSVCEPVIVVKWQGISGYQLWTVEHLENKLVDMRELYNERQISRDTSGVGSASTSSFSGACCSELDECQQEAVCNFETEDASQLSPMFETLFVSQEKHTLIGVANVFLEVLFHQLRLDYHVPILSQQGEVCGKLHVEVYRLSNAFDEESMGASSESLNSNASSDGTKNGENHGFMGNIIRCRVRIKKATNLPPNLSHFVFCQYSFFNMSEMLVVAPNMDASANSRRNGKIKPNPTSFIFDHQQDFSVLVTEEFLEYVQEDALSIEVWGHRSGGDGLESPQPTGDQLLDKTMNGVNETSQVKKSDENANVNTTSLNLFLPNPMDIAAQKRKSLQERWAEVTKRVALWVEIKELSDDGEYVNVEVVSESGSRGSNVKGNSCCTGGIYQLKQGQQRRITIHVRSLDEDQTSGTLPLSFSDIHSVAIGSITVKQGQTIIASANSSPQDYYSNGGSNWNLYDEEAEMDTLASALRPLDSYQEDDLDRIREQWSRALEKRQQHLEAQINELSAKGHKKSESDLEREQSLINQLVELVEERDAISVPNANIPGAPAEWKPPAGIEYHVPVVYLDLDADEIATDSLDENEGIGAFAVNTAGLNTILPFEQYDEMILLPLLEKDSLEMSVTCSWDSSIHCCHALNRPSNSNESIYAIVSVTCRLSYPFTMDLVLRKRICMSIYKKPSFANRIMRKFVGSGIIGGTGVYYDVVANIPKSSLDMEDRATLALMAVRQTAETSSSDSKQNEKSVSGNDCWSYVEEYTKSIRAVEWMLKLDRLRQESAVYSMLNRQDKRPHRASIYGLPASNMRMKRTISLPNNMSLPPLPPRIPKNSAQQTNSRNAALPPISDDSREIHRNGSLISSDPQIQRLMEVSASNSSGYSSMESTSRPTSLNLVSTMRPCFLPINSMVSPIADNRLEGIDEEQYHQVSELCSKETVIRSSTVPETLHRVMARNQLPYIDSSSQEVANSLSESPASQAISPVNMDPIPATDDTEMIERADSSDELTQGNPNQSV
ncbi:kinesin motor domain-containing protein [Ditylenchus destructor]|nr:kinesin motor domain-containing protein [Ditylenchus destructor]